MATFRPCKLEIRLSRGHLNRMLSVHFANFDQNCATPKVLKITRISRSKKIKENLYNPLKTFFSLKKIQRSGDHPKTRAHLRRRKDGPSVSRRDKLLPSFY